MMGAFAFGVLVGAALVLFVLNIIRSLGETRGPKDWQ